jgi:ribosomal protein S18 acetylase RimI-like enzyme
LIEGSITLRPITDADMGFLLALYATTRADELARVNWTDEQKAVFVRHQFQAQHEHWQTHYTDTSWDLILRDGVPIGRLYVARWPQEIRIVDIALVPAQRGSGIGAQLINELFDEADRAGKKVSVHVEIYNPAQRLYERLGFVPTTEVGVYRLLERPPTVLQ